jgi:hypothetical protein
LPALGTIEYIAGKPGKNTKPLSGGGVMDRELEVFVGEKRIATNEFARQIIISTLTGLLKPLKHVNTDEKIQITIGELKG